MTYPIEIAAQFPNPGVKLRYRGTHKHWLTTVIANAERELKVGGVYTLKTSVIASSWVQITLEETGNTTYALSFFELLPLMLQPRRWYAMLLVLPAGQQLPSPIWVYDVHPLKTGKKLMELHFWHANYPEGVQEKTYALRVLRHECGFMLAEETDPERRLVLLSEVTPEWLRPLFQETPEGDVQEWLDRKCGHF